MSETEISQQYCVRWNSHLCSLSTAFPQLLDQEKFVDVTLACEGQQVHCHKVVLAACSQYFDNLLSENPCKHPIIILPSDIKLWTIQALVEFMYKGQVNVSQAGLPDLVKSGDLLQIRGLCNTDITAGLTVQNNNNSAENSTAQVSKVVPTPNPPIAHMGNVARKEIGSGSPNKAHCGNNVPNDHSRSVSLDEEQQIKTEEIDEIGDEMEAEDPKNPDYAMANVMVEYDDERRNDSLNDTMDGYDSIDNLGNRRIRRPEATLREAAQCVSRGETFQKVSTMFNIPISTIRFYMARKGILPRRKRGRCTIPTSQINGNTISSTTTHLDMSSGSIIGSGNNQFSDSNPTPSDFITQPTTSNALNLRRSRSTSPVEPPYHFANFKLPELRPKLV